MFFKALSLRCQCGRSPLRIKEIGLTADHELAVYWHCTTCQRPVYAVKPLSECWVDCPTKDSPGVPLFLQAAEEAGAEDPGEEDRKFLRSVGVEPDPEPGLV